MAYFAVINGDKVVNRIVSESKDIAETATNSICIEVSTDTHFDIGWNYIDGTFVNPAEESDI